MPKTKAKLILENKIKDMKITPGMPHLQKSQAKINKQIKKKALRNFPK